MRDGDLQEHQVDAFFNMAVQGNKTKGGKVKMVNKDGAVVEYTRQKECCPLCPNVTMYLTTHLQRIHELKRNSDQYTIALQSARNYWGKDAEMIFEQQLIQRHQKKRKQDGNGGRPPKKARRKTGLELLAEELELPSSDDSSYREGEIGNEDDEQGSGDGCRVVAQRKRMLLRKREKVAEEVAVEGGDDEGEIPDEEDDDEGEVADEEDDDKGEVADKGDDEGGVADEGSDDEGGEEEPVYSDEEKDEVIMEMKKRSGKDDSMESEYEDEDDEDDEDDEEFEDMEMTTWKVYYKRGVAKTTRAKLLIEFCDDIQNILGGCKKENQAILHTQHV